MCCTMFSFKESSCPKCFEDLYYFCCGLHLLYKWACHRTQVCLWSSGEVHQSWMECRRCRTEISRRSRGDVGSWLHFFKGNLSHIDCSHVQFRDTFPTLLAIISEWKRFFFVIFKAFSGVVHWNFETLHFVKEKAHITFYADDESRLPAGFASKFVISAKLACSLKFTQVFSNGLKNHLYNRVKIAWLNFH